MKYVDESCVIIENREIANGIFDLTVKSDFIAKNAVCGQFANILCNNKMLRRPISICDTTDDTVRFVYQVKGGGTKWLSEQTAGTTLMVFGPLGNGFQIKDDIQNLTLIGGGIGTPPMLKTLKTAHKKGIKTTVILGFRTSSLVILEDEFKKYADNVIICTDDGSAGMKGFVTDALKTVDTDCVMACGPTPMLSAINGVCVDCKIKCYVSLEERMGCGVGACVCCVCRVQMKGFDGYTQVCKSGPVFDGAHIQWYVPKVITKDEFDGAKAVRQKVFCEEQGYAHEVEFDEFDEFTDNVRQLAIFDGRRIVATGRVIDFGNGYIKLGRIAVLPEYRKRGIGAMLLNALIDEARAMKADKITVDSQVQAMPFYEKFGFKVFGEEHLDGHVPHRYMMLEM